MHYKKLGAKYIDKENQYEIALLIARANAQLDNLPLPLKTTSDRVSDLKKRLNKPGVWIYIATEQGKITGLALGYPLESDIEYLSLLMVDPDHWNKGIASKLLSLLSHKSRHAGKKQIALWTRIKDNDHTRSFYERRSFITTGRTRTSTYGEQIEYRLIYKTTYLL